MKRGNRFEDLSGKRFGRLTVVEYAEMGGKDHHSGWLCSCDCGRATEVRSNHLKSGRVSSCGCYREEKRGSSTRTHGRAGTQEYKAWSRMKTRCLCQSHDAYPHYGGRGIEICAQWRESFENFLADVGLAPSGKHTLERIDVNGNYEPGNVKWATWEEQGNNKRNNRVLSLDGKSLTLSQWSRELGVSRRTLQTRLSLRWCTEDILTTPIRGK